MPVPTARPDAAEPSLFSDLSEAQIDAARLSSWYPLFRRITFPTTIINIDTQGEKAAFIEVSSVWQKRTLSVANAFSSGLTLNRYSFRSKHNRQQFAAERQDVRAHDVASRRSQIPTRRHHRPLLVAYQNGVAPTPARARPRRKHRYTDCRS
jgi:hypothetical protein